MNDLKKITGKVVLLLWDILIFTYQIIRKIILPNRRRKGNILSSLLSFFVGFIERILTFEQSILRQPFVFTHKYVRQALVIATTFLFLISSLEWTVVQHPASSIDETQAVVVDVPATNSPLASSEQQFAPPAPAPAGNVFALRPVSTLPPPPLSRVTITTKKYLRFVVFRI
jgi:hypothetical protein